MLKFLPVANWLPIFPIQLLMQKKPPEIQEVIVLIVDPQGFSLYVSC